MRDYHPKKSPAKLPLNDPEHNRDTKVVR